MQIRELVAKRNVPAWLLLVVAVALHVLDETLTGFLPFYNSFVVSLRDRLSFFPAPTFSFDLWLGGLVTAILLALALTIFVARGGRTIRWVVTILGVLMIVNALLHLSGSLYFGRAIPGTYSSPLLLLSAGYLVLCGIRGDWHFKKVRPEGTS